MRIAVGRLIHLHWARVRFSWVLYELLGSAEYVYHQFREGTLPPVVWKRWEITIGWWLSHPVIRVWWAN